MQSGGNVIFDYVRDQNRSDPQWCLNKNILPDPKSK